MKMQFSYEFSIPLIHAVQNPWEDLSPWLRIDFTQENKDHAAYDSDKKGEKDKDDYDRLLKKDFKKYNLSSQDINEENEQKDLHPVIHSIYFLTDEEEED